MPNPAPFRFNGATSFQTWKCQRRPRYHGPFTRFNGATSFQTWKWKETISTQGEPMCFNGATSFQTWKSQSIAPGNKAIAELQWGHVFSDVEI